MQLSVCLVRNMIIFRTDKPKKNYVLTATKCTIMFFRLSVHMSICLSVNLLIRLFHILHCLPSHVQHFICFSSLHSLPCSKKYSYLWFKQRIKSIKFSIVKCLLMQQFWPLSVKFGESHVCLFLCSVSPSSDLYTFHLLTLISYNHMPKFIEKKKIIFKTLSCIRLKLFL